MAILKNENRNVFDTTQIQRGFFIFGKHQSWPKGVNGLIADVREPELLVQFLPDIRNVTNHYRIQAEDVASGEWELRISPDLEAILRTEGVAVDAIACAHLEAPER